MAAKGGRSGNTQAVSIDVLLDLKSRFSGLDAPQGLFDPSAADAKTLETYGIPLPPDASAAPLEYAAWHAAFGKPLTITPFRFDDETVEWIEKSKFRLYQRQAVAQAEAASPWEGSTNWSGAYLTATGYKRFQRIWGCWKVPATLQQPPPPLGGSGNGFACSTWIGFDGQRRYFNSSLPQVGTASFLDVPGGGAVTAQAWIQWWARQEADPAPVILTLPVAPGDRIAAVLTATDPKTVIGWIVNLTTMTGMPVKGEAPKVMVGGTEARPDIAGATAEWVVERPAIPHKKLLYDMPDYGDETFSHCVAVAWNLSDPLSPMARREYGVRTARRIRMYQRLDGPARTQLVSTPAAVSGGLGATGLPVHYGGI
ncbi:MAG: hypothetical protein JSR21_11300 [Proteobacteria bacterium]|nr:hypothetical protein [Pseudomonadota bacterium]